MAGESFAIRIAEELGVEAQPALEAFLSSVGRGDWVGARGAMSNTISTADSVLSHESLEGNYGFDKLPPMFLHESTSLGNQSAKAVEESLARAESTPFKVLTSDGSSPGAPNVKWPLPTLRADGTWQSGKWLHMDEVPENSYFARCIQATRQGLHVSNVPGKWALGNRGVRVFEAELSDNDWMRWKSLLEPASKSGATPFNSRIGSGFADAGFNTYPSIRDGFVAPGSLLDSIEGKFGIIPPSLRDFPAEAVRLKRELFGDELKAIISR